MNLKTVNFEAINDVPELAGLTRKYTTFEYDYEGTLIPLELTLNEFQGNDVHDKYFSIDIFQGPKKYLGDEFETLDEAIADAEYRIEDYYESGNLNAKEFLYWEGEI